MNKQQHKSKVNCLPASINTMTQSNYTNYTPLSNSISTHQTNGLLRIHRTKSQIVEYPSNDLQQNKLESELQNLSKQNVTLREQNQQLKQQLLRLRTRSPQNPHNKKYSVSPASSNDLRGTIKKEKQMGEMAEMRRKLQMLAKQCKMYEEIIDKMEQRINKLTLQNTKNTTQIDELNGQLCKLQHLKDKCNGLMSLYSEMQSKFNSDQLEWMKWKQSWLAEKESYLLRIRQLQKITQR